MKTKIKLKHIIWLIVFSFLIALFVRSCRGWILAPLKTPNYPQSITMDYKDDMFWGSSEIDNQIVLFHVSNLTIGKKFKPEISMVLDICPAAEYVWVSSKDDIYAFDKSSYKKIEFPYLKSLKQELGLGDNSILQCLTIRDGSVLIYGELAMVFWKENSYKVINYSKEIASSRSSKNIYEDKNDGLWLIVGNSDVYKYSWEEETWDFVVSFDTLSFGEYNFRGLKAVTYDGYIWVLGMPSVMGENNTAVLIRWDIYNPENSPEIILSFPPYDGVMDMYELENGDIWIVTIRTVYLYSNGKIEAYPPPPTCLFIEDSVVDEQNQRLYLFCLSGYTFYRNVGTEE